MSEELARKAFEEALQGHFNGYGAEELGGAGWFQVYDDARRIAEQDGAEYGINAIQAAIRANQHGLMRLMARGATEPTPQSLCPALPDEAQQVYQHEAPCGGWLDAYVEYASQAAPMTPRSFHEAAALVAVSAAVARRCAIKLGDTDDHNIYPNLYILGVAESTLYTKSTGLNILEAIIRKAGLGFLLLTLGTPQGITEDMDHYAMYTRKPRQLDQWLQRRAHAGQRATLMGEASSLFAVMKREYNAGLLELLLDLYECKDVQPVSNTISRGEREIERAYLSMFGVSTPLEMGPHFANTRHWANGLWARWQIITPDAAPVYAFYPDSLQDPSDLTHDLGFMYRLFPVPEARIVEDKDTPDGGMFVQLANVPVPASVQLEPGVWDAWHAYDRAVRFDLLQREDMTQELRPNYGRLATACAKVATLLAVMDTDELPVVLTRAHWARAQRIVEGWRANLHCVWDQQSRTQDEQDSQKVLAYLKRIRPRGATVNDIRRYTKVGAETIQEVLAVLALAGEVDRTSEKAGNGRVVERWSQC